MTSVAVAAADPYPVAHCDSCKAPIIWTVTDHAQRMPVDAQPVDANSGGGNVVLTPGRPVRARVVTNPANLFGKTVYRSHFATCPYAERHRHPRARRRS